MHMACRLWRGAVNGIKDKEMAALVYHNLRVLMEESDIKKFKTMQKTIKQLHDSPSTQHFAEYFSIYLLCKKNRSMFQKISKYKH